MCSITPPTRHAAMTFLAQAPNDPPIPARPPKCLQARRAAAFHPDYLRQLCATLRQAGVNVDWLLARAGLDAGQLEDAEALMSFDATRWLILAVMDSAPRPGLALELGRAVGLNDHGCVGLAAACSRTLGDALEVVQRYAPLRLGALQLRLLPWGRDARLEADEFVRLGDVRRFVLEHLAATLVGLVHALTGRRAEGLTLHLPFTPPPWASAYKALGVRLHFNAPRLALDLTADWLAWPCLHRSNEGLATALQDCDAALAATHAPAYTAQVRALLNEAGGLTRGLDVAAQRLGVSRRTLNRRLHDEGTSWQLLHDDARREAAERLLLEGCLSIIEISRRLGYTDSSNFSRTVRRWFGSAPGTLREQRGTPA